MSTYKHVDRICCIVLAFTILLTVLFVHAEDFGVQKTSAVMGYEEKLFDTSQVHTIQILMEDWDAFLETCTEKEYANCTVIIDNETYPNTAIRGKGNTSLTQVEQYGNDRYSFKIEFDHYDNTRTYYGLDKLCLNNLIQDTTYLKDYLSYEMMREMGVAAPLCSYVDISVNGEDWGLYLAVEGIEESFLKRNYGSDTGALYKPDSTQMEAKGISKTLDGEAGQEAKKADEEKPDEANLKGNIGAEGEKPDQKPDGEAVQPGNGAQGAAGIVNEPPDKDWNGEKQPPDHAFGTKDALPSLPEEKADTESEQDQQEMAPDRGFGEKKVENGEDQAGQRAEGTRSEDVLLQYIDDDPASYSHIFETAKTDVTTADQNRLIAALKTLSSGEDVSSAVNQEAVLRYFVVHNFLLNFDSYTGSMIHNYYLYEQDGQMQMIPWDYNLAFGGFQANGSATELVNYPIDSPISDGTIEERPMLAWIFADEETTEWYHQLCSEWISTYFESGRFETLFDQVTSLIAPYVEKDPTKFYTYEEFETGSSTLREFCLLRAESIRGQLDGTIGSTKETQDSSTWIDAGKLQISDMGTMEQSRLSSFPSEEGKRPEQENRIEQPAEDFTEKSKIGSGKESNASSE